MTVIDLNQLLRLNPLPEIFSSTPVTHNSQFDPLLSKLSPEENSAKHQIIKECLNLLHLALKLKAYNWVLGTYPFNLKTFYKNSANHFLDEKNTLLTASENPATVLKEIINHLDNLLRSEEDTQKKLKFINPPFNFENLEHQESLKEVIDNLIMLKSYSDLAKKASTDPRVLKNTFDLFINTLMSVVNNLLTLSLSMINFYSALDVNATLTEIFGSEISSQLVIYPTEEEMSSLSKPRRGSMPSIVISLPAPVPVTPPAPSSLENDSHSAESSGSSTLSKRRNSGGKMKRLSLPPAQGLSLITENTSRSPSPGTTPTNISAEQPLAPVQDRSQQSSSMPTIIS